MMAAVPAAAAAGKVSITQVSCVLIRRQHRAPAPPVPKAPSFKQRLCAEHGIRDIPAIWDAVDVTREAAKHGANLPGVVDAMLKAQGDPPASASQALLEKAQRARAARRRWTEPAEDLAA